MQVSHRSAPGKLSWPQDGQSIRVAPFAEVRMTKFEVNQCQATLASQEPSLLDDPGVSTVEQLF